MQRIVEFKKRHFWTINIDMESLNQKVEQRNQDGWLVKHIIPNTPFTGTVASYSILLEDEQ